ncbi:uncharacterized protein [Watersipora subatra]|uniref:uncharacterized protein n=1 Tax=Watersipora subatra TaxID=2589382 RepID=UPI00355C13E5
MDSWFLVAVRSSPGSAESVAEDPMRRLCLGKLRNIPTQVMCIAMLVIQAFFLNEYLAAVYKDDLQWLWFFADIVVVALFILSFYLKEWRLQHVSVNHRNQHEFAKGLPYAPGAWLVYGSLLSARVIDLFINNLRQHGDILGLKSAICASALICIFFTWSHHHNHESLARRASILSLVKLFTIDVLDTVDILDILFEIAESSGEEFPKVLEYLILAIITLNILHPSVVLVSLFYDHFAKHRTALIVKILKTHFELLLINIPLLIIRIYLAATYVRSISVFLVKNILGIIFGLIEIYDCSYDIHVERIARHHDLVKVKESRTSVVKGNYSLSGLENGNVSQRTESTRI